MAARTQPIKSPFAPLSRIAPLYMNQTVMDLQVNMQTQKVYPTEVYKGYREVNEYRKKHGMWYSTGAGEHSFGGQVYQADDQRGMLTVGIHFNDYLRYVDIGVGLTGNPHDPAAHVTADKVERGRKAKYKSRYIRGKWDRLEGKSHRPFLMRTIRHLQTRYQHYMADFYGYQGGITVINAFAGMGKKS